MTQKNEKLEWLDDLEKKVIEINKQKEAVIQEIRDGFKNKVIIFIDVVNSTRFKIDHIKTPEVWILRIKQFCELLTEAVEKCGGSVVKYIGDEIMASFDNINDAKNIICRIKEIEDNLKQGTGFETRIKIAIDYGPVYEINFENHPILDPQGSAVDRCARIARYCEAGEVLASSEFVNESKDLKWNKLGEIELKGLGPQEIYQLERSTITLDEKIEVKKIDYEKIKEESAKLRIANSEKDEVIRKLSEQLTNIGAKPIIISNSDDREGLWSEIEDKFEELKNLIDDSPGSPSKYARFIFLCFSQNGFDEYNKFSNKFDELIEAKLVIADDNKHFELNPKHPRNKRILSVTEDTNDLLYHFLEHYDPDSEDLFEWSLSAPEFWEKYIGYRVL